MHTYTRALRVFAGLTLAAFCLSASMAAQSGTAKPTQPQTQGNGAKPAPPQPAGTTTPPDYVIGPEDVLGIVFWREKDISSPEVVVRPDGKISLLLVNEVQAAGLTPEELRLAITKAASKLFQDEPTVSVGVRQINSRKVYIMGAVGKPGAYPLNTTLDVLQLITLAGGLNEYADSENIQLIRVENGVPKNYRINYKEIERGRNLTKNLIWLRVGDRIIVPE
jgi:polysaccharide biosynthesis/export protein